MRHNRHSIRLRGYDYSRPGAYFVTICAQDRQCLFGNIVNGEMTLNDAGRIVEHVWFDLPNHYSNVELDQYVIMPNHFHGIIILSDSGMNGNQCTDSKHVGVGFKPAPTVNQCTDSKPVGVGFKPAPTKHGLPEIVRAFKTFSSRRINEMQNTSGAKLWQRNYYEHIIRNTGDLNRIRKYIQNNPRKWDMDRENLVRFTNRRI